MSHAASREDAKTDEMTEWTGPSSFSALAYRPRRASWPRDPGSQIAGQTLPRAGDDVLAASVNVVRSVVDVFSAPNEMLFEPLGHETARSDS